MSNFKSQAKRKRELAKLDKRNAKDQKRALRKAERSGVDVPATGTATAVGPQLVVATDRHAAPPPKPKPLTFAEAVERWKNTKIAKPKKR
jgi:hypothetical protein